ncbi:MAG: formylmethanofuran dehydrogenase subunit A [Candidatus Methanoperedens sp.]|nr:formylmethanofuran dehydrogenase subunit A [Candidatus Methanoperedens sp.]MCZ7395720.1 formylmethanofuran dehydrogenase subunit A [Candidatus Methanoperedens sp.]
MELLIKNGAVYDPINGIAGDKTDISIKDGKIVEKVSSSASVIDAGGRLVMPGGVDAHSHIAGAKVNLGRLMRPEDSRIGLKPRTKVTRVYSGYTVPNVYAMGYRYAQMGYTTVFEAAQAIMKARHTHEELEEIPIIDKGALTLFGSNWPTMDYVREKNLDKLAAYVAWGLLASRGFGVKVVNPGGGEMWGFGKNVTSLDDVVPNFDVTPAQIIVSLMKANEMLGLPHSVHLHCNNLGKPGNYKTTLASMELAKQVKPSKERQVLHVTHLTFNAWGGTNWGDFESKADEIANYLNNSENVTTDMGQLIFGSATTMTADGPVQYANAKLLHAKWGNGDVELEDASGVVPIFYARQISIHAIMWAIGLELALLTKDPYKVLLTTDHPNGGPFVNYPEVIALLMSNKKRQEEIKTLHEAVHKRTKIPGITRELDFNDIAIMTRGGPAKVLGLLESKGHLGVGADADVSIYDILPDQIDPSVEHARIKSAFSSAAYTLKGGEVVVKDGQVVATPMGRTFWVNASVPEQYMNEVMKDMEMKFRNYYSIQLANYMVQDAYVTHPRVVRAGVAPVMAEVE